MAIDGINARVTYAPTELPWATGRFYGSTFSSVITGSAGGLGSTNVTYDGIYIPNPAGITIVTIGINVTIACNANSVGRFGIYSSKYGDKEKEDYLPDTLLVDGGTVLLDATGYRSVTVNKFLRQGWYFTCCAKNPTSGSGNHWSGLQRSTLAGDILLQGSPNGVSLSLSVSTATLAVNGLYNRGIATSPQTTPTLRIIVGT